MNINNHESRVWSIDRHRSEIFFSAVMDRTIRMKNLPTEQHEAYARYLKRLMTVRIADMENEIITNTKSREHTS